MITEKKIWGVHVILAACRHNGRWNVVENFQALVYCILSRQIGNSTIPRTDH